MRLSKTLYKPSKKFAELQLPSVTSEEKKDKNDAISIHILSSELDKYGYNGFHTDGNIRAQ